MDDNDFVIRKRKIYKGGKLVEEREERVPKPKQATFWGKAKNATAAAGRVVTAAVKGDVLRVDAQTQQERFLICSKCEYFTGFSCSLCGCVSKWKTTLATEHCPLPEPKW
jgi:hypothetical protein